MTTGECFATILAIGLIVLMFWVSSKLPPE